MESNNLTNMRNFQTRRKRNSKLSVLRRDKSRFEIEEELCELTGLTEHEIIDIGLGKEYNKLNKMDLIHLKR